MLTIYVLVHCVSKDTITYKTLVKLKYKNTEYFLGMALDNIYNRAYDIILKIHPDAFIIKSKTQIIGIKDKTLEIIEEE